MIIVEDYNVITDKDDFTVIEAKLEATRKSIRNIQVKDYLAFIDATLKTIDPEHKLYTISQICIAKNSDGTSFAIRDLSEVSLYPNSIISSVTYLKVVRIDER